MGTSLAKILKSRAASLVTLLLDITIVFLGGQPAVTASLFQRFFVAVPVLCSSSCSL